MIIFLYAALTEIIALGTIFLLWIFVKAQKPQKSSWIMYTIIATQFSQ